jgi:hypothetical protein
MTDQSEAVRLRSPPFPAISIQKAIERANQLYAAERDHLVPIASAARAWNMSPTSSGPVQTVGALKQYGLLVDEGANAVRKVRLTHDALRIILDKTPSSTERQNALQRCFLAPKIFSEIWGKYGNNLPSDQTVINQLTLERKLSGEAPYSETGAIELLGNYRLGMSFASPQVVQDAPHVPDSLVREDEMMAPEITPETGKPVTLPAGSMPRANSVSGVVVGQGERVVFIEEGEPGQQIKLVAAGSLDEYMLDALENYIARQKRRLKRPSENN